MRYFFICLLLSSCFFDGSDKRNALEKKYSINTYFEKYRQTPDRKLAPFIFIILERTKKGKFEEVEERFEKGFEIFGDQEQLYLEHVKYFMAREQYEKALDFANKYSERFPRHAQLLIVRDGLKKILNGEEKAKENLEQDLNNFKILSRQFARAKIKQAMNQK